MERATNILIVGLYNAGNVFGILLLSTLIIKKEDGDEDEDEDESFDSLKSVNVVNLITFK